MTAPPVRLIRRDEYDRVGHLLVAAYDAVGSFDDRYRSFLGDPRRWVPGCSAALVAVDGDDLAIGTVAYVRPGDEEFEGTHPPAGDAGFRFLGVDVAWQGSGAGRALVQACIDRARQDGARRMAIHSMSFMTEAHRLYARMGFDRRPDLDVMFPAGLGYALTLNLVDDAPDHFQTPGAVPEEAPWFEDAWGLTREPDDSPIC